MPKTILFLLIFLLPLSFVWTQDTIDSIQIQTDLAIEEMENNMERKEIELAQLEELVKIQQQKRNQMISIVVGGIVLFLALLVFLIIIIIRAIRK